MSAISTIWQTAKTAYRQIAVQGKGSGQLAVVLAMASALAASPAVADEHMLAFPVAGVVAEVMVSKGQTVKAGDVLARLDITPLKAKKDAAEAALKAAESQLDFSTKNKERVQQLFDDLSTSAEELEKASIELARAKAEMAMARARVELATWELNRATLLAPAAGTVSQIQGYAGMVVNPNAAITPVVTLSVR